MTDPGRRRTLLGFAAFGLFWGCVGRDPAGRPVRSLRVALGAVAVVALVVGALGPVISRDTAPAPADRWAR